MNTNFPMKYTNLIASGSFFKAWTCSELVDKPPLLATLLFLFESLVSCDCVTECCTDELLLSEEDTISSSSFISSMTKPINQSKFQKYTYKKKGEKLQS